MDGCKELLFANKEEQQQHSVDFTNSPCLLTSEASGLVMAKRKEVWDGEM